MGGGIGAGNKKKGEEEERRSVRKGQGEERRKVTGKEKDPNSLAIRVVETISLGSPACTARAARLLHVLREVIMLTRPPSPTHGQHLGGSGVGLGADTRMNIRVGC